MEWSVHIKNATHGTNSKTFLNKNWKHIQQNRIQETNKKDILEKNLKAHPTTLYQNQKKEEDNIDLYT